MGAANGRESLETMLVNRALEANAAGDYFPVWGTCKGYENLLNIVGKGNVLDFGFDAVDYATPLRATNTGRMLADANASLLEWVANEPITYNNHGAGITPAHLASNSALSAFFDVLGVSNDRGGRPMVELVQGKHSPIYGAQFHNEKIQFIPDSGQIKHIPKSAHAVAFAEYMGSFFVAEARKNRHAGNGSAPLAVDLS